MGLALGIGNAIPFSKGAGWSYTDNLDLEYSRSGLSLPESFSGDSLNATIIPACAKCDATHYLKLDVANFGSGVTAATGGKITKRVYYTGENTLSSIFASGDVTGGSYFHLSLVSGKPYIRMINVAPAIDNGVRADDAISVGWHKIVFETAAQKYKITIDDGTPLTVGAGLSLTIGSNNGKWIGDITERDNISVGYLLRTSTTYSDEPFYSDYLNFNGTNKWVFTESGGVEYDIIGGSHLLWNVTTSAKLIYLQNAGSHLLDIGFRLYKHANPSYHCVPYTSAEVPYNADAYETGLSYVKVTDYAGDASNLIKGSVIETRTAPFLIGFNETSDADSRLEIFDRSNTTIFEDIARTSIWYDATSLATRSRFHSSEIMFIDNLQSLYKTGYKNRVFPINDDLDNPTKVTGFLVYNTERT